MDFYIDTNKNHHYQLQNSTKTVLSHCLHTSSFQHLLNRYPAPTSLQNLPSSFLDIQYINKNPEDGSNNSTMVAPLKQPYSMPSLKKVFHEIHTTKNFRSTKHWILQELQLNFKNKVIRNLSSHQVPPNESEVLALSLNFVPTPSASTHPLIQKSTTRLTQTMKKQLYFKNQPLTIK